MGKPLLEEGDLGHYLSPLGLGFTRRDLEAAGSRIKTSTFSNNRASGGAGQSTNGVEGAGPSFGSGLFASGSTTLVQVNTFFNNTASVGFTYPK